MASLGTIIALPCCKKPIYQCCMKSVYFSVLIGAFCILLSCNQFKSDHPQADLTDQHATDLTAKSIAQYADSIDKNSSGFLKTTSLVYLLGDLSFYVEKLSSNDRTILLIEHVFNGGNSKSLKKYYFKNDSLILEKVNAEIDNEEGTVFKDSRTYLRSNTVFKIENRTASSHSTLSAMPFVDVPLSQNPIPDQNYLSDVNSLHEVINGTNKFDMVFDNITTYPDSRYIILKSKIPNSYIASIVVQEKDELIDSLLNDPINFKDQKLNIQWVIKDHEAVYVPRE
jgi:hypothetical protein